MELSLSGKTALVCGASQGIGASTAQELASLGAKVILLARSLDKLNDVATGLSGQGHAVIACDINDRTILREKVSAAIESFGGIDVLVCNSGGPKGGALLDADVETFQQGFENHVLANMDLINLVVPKMKENSFGRIINIISTSVKAPIPNLGVSNTIRGAVANLAKTLSLELGPFGITVNNVLPGYTATPRLEALVSGASKRMNKSTEEVKEIWKAKVPLGRFADPEEVANAVAFLASPAGSYISGINLPVDGGRTPSL